jgi:hypothetical protein
LLGLPRANQRDVAVGVKRDAYPPGDIRWRVSYPVSQSMPRNRPD